MSYLAVKFVEKSKSGTKKRIKNPVRKLSERRFSHGADFFPYIIEKIVGKCYNNFTRLTKINFCAAFALNTNNSRSLKYGEKKSLRANFFSYIKKHRKY